MRKPKQYVSFFWIVFLIICAVIVFGSSPQQLDIIGKTIAESSCATTLRSETCSAAENINWKAACTSNDKANCCGISCVDPKNGKCYTNKTYQTLENVYKDRTALCDAAGVWRDCDAGQWNCNGADDCAGLIGNCPNNNCWIKAGEAGVGEYTDQTTAQCCGDDVWDERYSGGTDGTWTCCDGKDAQGNSIGLKECVLNGKCRDRKVTDEICNNKIDDDCDGETDENCVISEEIIETSKYKIILGGIDESLADGKGNGVIKEIYVKNFDPSSPVNKPCTNTRCYSFSILNPKVDARISSHFGWVNRDDSHPYTSDFLYSKWIYQDVTQEILPNDGSLYHLRYKADKIRNSSGSVNYDGEWYIEYWFYENYFDVEYGFKSNSDALISTLINIPIPPLKDGLISNWYIDNDNKGDAYPAAATIQNPEHFGVGLYNSSGLYVSVSNLLLDNLNHGFNSIQLVGKYSGPPYYVDGGVIAFFTDNALNLPRDPLLAEGPSMGKWYNSRYRVKLGVASSTENEIEQDVRFDFEEAAAYKYLTVPQTPYGLVPVSIFMHDADPFLDKETNPNCQYPDFTYIQNLKKSYPRLKTEFYFLISPDYSKFYSGLICYDHDSIAMDCNPSDSSCWVDETKKRDILSAESEGWLIFSRHGDKHDGNKYYNATGADWYLLNEEETKALYNRIGGVLTNFGAETHYGKDIVPSHWFISSTGLRGLRELNIKSLSGICAFQMADPSLLEPGINKIPNYRWHFLDNLDIVYVEQPYAATLGDYPYFLNDLSTVDRFVDNGVPLFFYNHAPDPSFMSDSGFNYYKAVINRIETYNKDDTSWFFPYEFGSFLYGLKKVKYDLVSADPASASIIVDNSATDSEDVKGLTFRLEGYSDSLGIDSITTSLDTTANIMDKHSFWLDIPKGSILRINVLLTERMDKKKGVLSICVKENENCLDSIPITVHDEHNLIYDNLTTSSPVDISLDVGTYNITIGNEQFSDVYINRGRTELHSAQST